MSQPRIRGICVSTREESEYRTLCNYIHEITPDVLVYSFQEVLSDPALLDHCDFIFTLGGDGTVAWLIKQFFEKFGDVRDLKPIVPVIRPSSVGYLMQLKFERDEFIKGYKKLVAGEYFIENRTVLSAIVGGKRRLAVNEFYISCAPQLCQFQISILNGETHFTSMTKTMADGVMIVTSIGSTGWGLSYNGMINLNENSLQIIFVGGVHSAANFVVPRRPIIVKLTPKNSPVTEETIRAYQFHRLSRGLEEDPSPVTTTDIMFSSRLIIDGKVEEFGIEELEIDSSMQVPFVFMYKETNVDKARKLTEQPNVKKLSY